jgi:hypothetical protein
MKYWRINDFDEALDKPYINAMMLNACIPSYEEKDGDSGSSGQSMSFFEFGEQLAGLK